MIAAISVAFIAGTLTAGTLVEATTTTTEPLNNINSFFLNPVEIATEKEALRISSDAPYKVDYCATNNNKKIAQIEIGQFKGGVADPIDFLVNIPPYDTNCIHFGGQPDVIFWVGTGRSSSQPSISDSLLTVATTPTGTVTVEVCEIGEKGPFNCQSL